MRYVFGEALTNIRHGGIVSLLAILIVAVTTVLFASLYAMRNIVRVEVARFEENPMVVVFPEEDVPDAGVQNLAASIEDVPGVQRTVVVSKEEALARSRRIFGEAAGILLEGFDTDNPLPRSIEIYPAADFQRQEPMRALVDHLETVEGVESVQFAEQAPAMIQQARNILFMLGALVAVISVVVIAFSIMITIYARRKELAILRLVGATNGFIRVPLVLQGCFAGFIGSEVGMGIFYALHRRFGGALGFQESLPVEQTMQIVLGATVIGMIGGMLPLRNRLKMVP